MTKKILMIFGVLLVLAPVATAYALSSEIHVTKDGKASISAAKVTQFAGNTLFTRLYWGDAFIRFTIKTNSNTKFLRAGGEATTIAEIKVGDLLDVAGELEPSDTLTLKATSVKNSSVQKERSELSGTVISIDASDARQFLLNSKDRGVVTVKVATSTQFIKGSRIVDFDHLRIGDSIIKTSGDFDLPSKTLAAQSVKIYIDPNTFKPQNFVGKLAEVPATPESASIKVTINKIPYTIVLTDKTLIMRNNRSTTTLQRFIVGDPIRLYGAIREIDEPTIDAEVIRNLNL